MSFSKTDENITCFFCIFCIVFNCDSLINIVIFSIFNIFCHPLIIEKYRLPALFQWALRPNQLGGTFHLSPANRALGSGMRRLHIKPKPPTNRFWAARRSKPPSEGEWGGGGVWVLLILTPQYNFLPLLKIVHPLFPSPSGR